MSSSEELNCTPPEIRDAANTAIKELLPGKSKSRYENAYKKFIDWAATKQIQTYTENCLLAYFQTVVSKKSFWSIYSMLRSCLLINDKIDISKFTMLLAYLKKETKMLKPKKSEVLSNEHIYKFLSEAPDSTFLLMKVVLVMGISGACRREELCRMCVHDIELKPNIIIVKIPDTKTNVSRTFTVIKTDWINIILKYIKLRPGNVQERFFLTYRNGKCISSPVGLNTIGKIPMKIAEYLQLDNASHFTGHCFRRSSATLLAEHGGDLLSIKRQGGWRSSSVAEGYVESSSTSHGPCDTISDQSFTTINIPSASDSKSGGVKVENCENCTINIYNNCTMSVDK